MNKEFLCFSTTQEPFFKLNDLTPDRWYNLDIKAENDQG